jgi:NADH-ubiquinone oxidoreductase chain 5
MVLSIYYTEFSYSLLVKFKQSISGYNTFIFLNQRFLVEMYYNRYISGIVLRLGGQTTKDLDKGVVERVGPYGLQKLFTNISQKFNLLSTGVVTDYALYIVIGLILYISIYLLDTYIIFILLANFFNLETKHIKPEMPITGV